MASQYPQSEAKPETNPRASGSGSSDADKGIADKASGAVGTSLKQHSMPTLAISPGALWKS